MQLPRISRGIMGPDLSLFRVLKLMVAEVRAK